MFVYYPVSLTSVEISSDVPHSYYLKNLLIALCDTYYLASTLLKFLITKAVTQTYQ
jgi:hypothetical protein